MTTDSGVLYRTAIGLICCNMLAMSMIIVGAGNLQNCPMQVGIEIYLLGSGITVVLTSIIGVIIQRKINKKFAQPVDRRFYNITLNITALIINFAWSVPGGYWVFSNMVPNFVDTSAPDFCHKDSYFLSLWTCVITWLVALTLLYHWYSLDRAILRNEIMTYSQDDSRDEVQT